MNLDLTQMAIGAAATAGLGLAVVAARTWARRRGGRARRGGTAASASPDLDPATGLMTLGALELALQDQLLRAEKAGSDCCILHVAIDDFRLVVDDRGRAFADKVLAALAARLRAAAGASTPLARVAGDEFALCLIGPREEGEALARGITESVCAPLGIDGHEVEPGVSVGLAVAPAHGTGVRLIGKAAAATHAVQRSGGRAHAVFDPVIEAELNNELTIARGLKEAIAKGQIELFFQPKIDARRLEVSTAEALLRWRHPAMGLVSPAQFIPVAERHGLIEPLGQWVLDEALKKAAAWRSAGLNFHVALNVFGTQFRREDFAARVTRSLKAHGVPAGSLVCELSEAVALEDTEANRRGFARLHKTGVRISIGDVSGHDGALAALAELPAQEVKIARSLVALLPSDAEARRTVERIVATARSHGLRVVAEGVENEAQRDQAIHLGCDELQGFLFAKPMSARGVALWAVDASRNLAQTLRPSQFKDTMIADVRPAAAGFAKTQIAPRR